MSSQDSAEGQDVVYSGRSQTTERRTISIVPDPSFVTIRLENDPDTYLVRKDQLYSASRFFMPAIPDQDYPRPTNQVIILSRCEKSTLHIFLSWVANRRLPEEITNDYLLETEQERRNGLARDAERRAHDAQVALAKLWIFGDRVECRRLQNTAIKEFWRLARFFALSVPAVHAAMQSHGGSQLRRAALELSTMHLRPCDIPQLKEEVDEDFFELVFDLVARGRGCVDPFHLDPPRRTGIQPLETGVSLAQGDQQPNGESNGDNGENTDANSGANDGDDDQGNGAEMDVDSDAESETRDNEDWRFEGLMVPED